MVKVPECLAGGSVSYDIEKAVEVKLETKRNKRLDG